MEGKIIAIVNQKGGVAKTTTAINLGAELAKQKKKVLMVDFDPQGNLSVAFGIENDEILSIADLMQLEIDCKELPDIKDLIIRKKEMDIIPSNLVLATVETSLVVASCREFILESILCKYKKDYDYILIDCGPSLGMLMINALAAANSVIIPVEGNYLPAKGLELLLQSIARTKRKINPQLRIEGILLTKIDTRTGMSKEILEMIQEAYGELRIFKNVIPLRVAVEKAIRKHILVSEFDEDNEATLAYRGLAREVVSNE